MGFGRRVRKWLGIPSHTAAAAIVAAPEGDKAKRLFSPAAMSDLAAFFGSGREVRDLWQAPERPKWVDRWLATAASGADGGQVRLAMDSVPFADLQDYAMASSPWSEGLGFMGYGYLAELQQRPEYRRISEIWAAECCRKWIKIKGDDPKRVAAIEKLFRDFGVREKFRKCIEIDGGQGRSHIFMDFGDKPQDRHGPLKLTRETVPVGSLVNLKVAEPFWCYPLQFGTTDPLAADFYVPSQWQLMGNTVHNTRLLTFVGRELPDILKPVYMFGGLSLSQMAKPYIDNFIKNRTSVANLLYSFSTMVLSTNMGAMLSPEGAGEIINRIKAYVYGRDNGGLMLVDKETEELTNVAAPLAGIKDLLEQAQEFICSTVGIPRVQYLGTTTDGLGASSEGEISTFRDHIRGYQEKTLQGPLTTMLTVFQLHLDGVVDDKLTFEFVNLDEPTDQERAELRKTNMETATGYITAGVLAPEDERKRLETEEHGLWFGMKLQEPPEPEEYDEDEEGDDPDKPGGKANDAELRAAAVVCLTPERRFLLVQRGLEGDHPGTWAFPGGHIDAGEQPGAAAGRELMEECGYALATDLEDAFHTSDGVAFYLAPVTETFTPTLNHESLAYEWATKEALPWPLHPSTIGVLLALEDTGPGEPRGGRANDETQHWITVHPDGPDSKGTPMLVTSGGKVVGGAGGKLDGKVLHHIKSQSGARARGNKPERPAGHQAPSAAPEHHQREGESHQDHATRLSIRAHRSGIAEHHFQAEAAHTRAAEEADAGKDRADWIRAASHKKSATLHNDLGNEAEGGTDWATEHARGMSTVANATDPKAKTAQGQLDRMGAHARAYQAHQTALRVALRQRPGDNTDTRQHEHADAVVHHRKEATAARDKAESLAKSEKRKAAAERAKEIERADGGTGKTFEENNARHVAKSHAELDSHFRERWGMGVHKATNAAAEYAAFKRSPENDERRRWDTTPERRDELQAKYEALHEASRSQHGRRVSSHSDVDLDDKGPRSKVQKQILGHVEAALEHLENQGFDVKRALSEARVHYAPGGTGTAIGHAYPLDGNSYFAISDGKHNQAYHQQQRDRDQRAMANGKPTWSATASSPASYAPQAVIIHELVHAVAQHAGGKRTNGTEKLLAQALAASGIEGGTRAFVHQNISEYALKNMSETEAELGAKVTAPGYVRGSLPKALEDHVDAMFKHKGRNV